MTYYRMALRDRQTATWIWKTTVLTSLQAVLQLLKSYSAIPQDRIRVFTAASKEDLNEMLRCENTNLASGSVTASQFLRDRKLQVPGQGASAYGKAEPAVRQSTAVATISPPRKYSTATGFPGFGETNPLERRRMEIENGPGGDHDTPYRFTLPVSTPQLLAWIRLQARIQAGELQP
jgi:hypothetical protein